MKEVYIQAEELLGEEVVEMLERALKDSINIDFRDEQEARQLVESLKEVIDIINNYEDKVTDKVEDLMAYAADYYVDMYKDGDL